MSAENVETKPDIRILTHPDTKEVTGIVFLSPDLIKLNMLVLLTFRAIDLEYDIKIAKKTPFFEHLTPEALEETLLGGSPLERKELIEDMRYADSLIIELPLKR